MAACLKTSVGWSWLVAKVAAGFGEPIIWREPSLEERELGGRDQDWAKRGDREGRKGMDERGRSRQRQEGITKLTTKKSKEKTKQTRHGAFWQHSFDKDHR